MRNLFRLLSLSFLMLALSSCGTLTNDEFVYLGHGDDTPNYQLYYDKTQKLFIFIDKKNGCFQKDDTGTCFALSLKQAREFREKVLAKMIDIELRLAKDDYGDFAVKKLESAGITTVNKPIKTTALYAKLVRQIVVDKAKEYHLVRGEHKINANLVAMIVQDINDSKKIKVAYTVSFPGIAKKYNIQLKPFIMDPEYMYTHLTMDSVHEAQFMQKDVLNNQKEVTKQTDDYLKSVVDKDEPKQDADVEIAKGVASGSDLVADNPLLEPNNPTTENSDTKKKTTTKNENYNKDKVVDKPTKADNS